MLPEDIRENVRRRRHLLTFWPLHFDGSVPLWVRASVLLHPVQVLQDATACVGRDVMGRLNVYWMIVTLSLFVSAFILTTLPGVWAVVALALCGAVMCSQAVMHLSLSWHLAYRRITLLERSDHADPGHVMAVLDVWMPKLGVGLPSHHSIFAMPLGVLVTEMSSPDAIYRVTDRHDDKAGCFTCVADAHRTPIG